MVISAVLALLTSPVSRPSHFYLADLQESRRYAVSQIIGTNPGNNITFQAHALKFGYAHQYYFPSNYTGRVAVLSIKTDKWGVIGDVPQGAQGGFDPEAGTSPGGSWMHFPITPSTVWPPDPTNITTFLAYFTGGTTGGSAASLTGSNSESIVYRESGNDGSQTHKVVFTYTFAVLKNMANGDCPIDTRKTYNGSNEANADQWYSDANTTLRNLNFDPYSYRGGMFIGHMPYRLLDDNNPQSPIYLNDRSGTARLQLWFPEFDLSPFTNPSIEFVTHSIYDMRSIPPRGSFTQWADSLDLKYGAGTAGTSESDTTWSNGWAIPTSPAPKTAHLFATSPAADQDFVSMPITLATPTSTSTNADWRRYNLVWAKDEATYQSAGTVRWRYFATKEAISNGNSSDTLTDFKPRSWGVISLNWDQVTTEPNLALPRK
ncbi:MAG: hypothetical protein ABL949_04215 [Fimbriimonadaceae bacterium]